jgi:hypothetical protein
MADPDIKFNETAARDLKSFLGDAANAAVFAGGSVYLRGLRENISIQVGAGIRTPSKFDSPTDIKPRFPTPLKVGVEGVKSGPKNKSSKPSKKFNSKKTPKGGKREPKPKVVRSKPGEPPRRETGALIISWNVRKENDGTAVVGPNKTTPYALFLETGTRNKDNSIKMRPRPYIVRSFDEHKERITAIIVLVLKRKFGI